MDLAGKTAVITGGASGIGLATARRFAAAGANLVLGDVEAGPLDDAVSTLAAAGAAVIGVGCDVSVEADVAALREAALAEFGAAHLVFNNAGVGGGAAIGTPESMWEWIVGVNLMGVVHGVNAFVPHFLETGEGYVVNTASLAGLNGVPYMGPYCATKFAVVGLSESLYHELAIAGRDVHVSVLCPGFVRTRIHESFRNAPGALRPLADTAEGRAMVDIAGAAVNAGIDPSVVADAIADAVAANRFWILTHPRAAVGVTGQRQEWMRGGPAPSADLDAATRP